MWETAEGSSSPRRGNPAVVMDLRHARADAPVPPTCAFPHNRCTSSLHRRIPGRAMLAHVYKSLKKADTYVYLAARDDFARLPEPLRTQLGALAFVLEVDLVQTSCGFGVPLYGYEGERPSLARWAESKGEEGLEAYRREKNAVSIDGLPTGF